MSIARSSDLATFDPAAPLTPSGNLRRRLWFSGTVQTVCSASTLVAVAALAVVVYTVVSRGAPAISVGFFTKDPPTFGGAGGGIRSAIIGSALIVAVATLLATPIGVLIAVYLVELSRPSSRTARALRLALDLMQSLPSIVIGLFAFGLLVRPEAVESGLAGSVALAIIALPLIARSTQEVLLLVPRGLREAADALGVNRWRTVLTVVLPTATSGILTGTILAIARAAGETAPLLLVDSIFAPQTTFDLFKPVPNLPVSIFTTVESADPSAFTRAWGEALVLLGLILLANVGARSVLARQRRRLTR